MKGISCPSTLKFHYHGTTNDENILRSDCTPPTGKLACVNGQVRTIDFGHTMDSGDPIKVKINYEGLKICKQFFFK